MLGYPNEYGLLTERPLLAASADPDRVLPPRRGVRRRDLGRNGTYLVLRQLRQDVDGFRRYVADAARPDGRTGPGAQLLAAKMVGRWPSGAPLVLAPAHDDPVARRRQRLRLPPRRPRGLALPDRRARPADQPARLARAAARAPRRSMAINRRHRLLRRGRSYGSPDGDECGLHFIVPQREPGPPVRVRPAHLGEQPGVQRARRRDRPAGRAAPGQAAATFTDAGPPGPPPLPELPQFVTCAAARTSSCPASGRCAILAGARSSTT